ncbi:MAG: hypothetical protein HQL49_12215 [Gammaproteobacteria bacterium]|nr:hypothetical protein [Gammaproteobacteria bacterium]
MFVPVELVDQGLELILSGLNNTLAIQCNLDWIWPWWVEQQQNPAKSSFIPTGISLVTTNLSQRNWTSIGVFGSCYESMVDPVGMVTLHPFGWSVLPYLKLNGRHYLPTRMDGAISQALLDGVIPAVVTCYTTQSGLDWHSTISALNIDGEEVIDLCHTLHNHSTAAIAVTFGLSIRPYNPLTIGHINKIRLKKGLWRVNGVAALLLLETADRHAVADRNTGDPILIETLHSDKPLLTSRSGIAAGVSEYRLTLAPGESRTLTALAPLSRQSASSRSTLSHLTTSRVAAARGENSRFWQQQSQRGTLVTLPDLRWQTLFTALKNHLHVFDDGSHFSPGNFFYHDHWFRDSAFIAAAFEMVGFTEAVDLKVKDYLRRQTRSGFFRSQNGEWDSNGQAMVTLVNHVRYTGNRDLLLRIYPALLQGTRWIKKMRTAAPSVGSPYQTLHDGLLPAGFSAEHFGPNDHYYWDNFWSLAAIRVTLWAAETLQRDKDIIQLSELLDQYQTVVDNSIGRTMAQMPDNTLSCSPYRRMDSAAIGNLIALVPLNLYPLDAPWVAATLDYLYENNVIQGLFYQKIIHTGLNIYLTVQLARVLQLRQDERWEVMFEAIMAHATPTLTWPEAIHPRTGGGCMGDGDHGWATAEVLVLMRSALVCEQGQALWLGVGIPERWYREDLHLAVNSAATLFGLLSFQLTQCAGELILTWQLQPHEICGTPTLILYLPQCYRHDKRLMSEPCRHPRWQQFTLPETAGTLCFHSDLQPSPTID